MGNKIYKTLPELVRNEFGLSSMGEDPHGNFFIPVGTQVIFSNGEKVTLDKPLEIKIPTHYKCINCGGYIPGEPDTKTEKRKVYPESNTIPGPGPLENDELGLDEPYIADVPIPVCRYCGSESILRPGDGLCDLSEFAYQTEELEKLLDEVKEE